MRLRPAILISLMVVGASCGPLRSTSEPSAPPETIAPSPEAPFKSAAVLIDTERGSVIFEAEVAQTEAERQQGLMGRDELGEGEAMLFVFFEPTSGGFWMKDTKIPLSVAFLSRDSRILQVIDMEPCEKDPCPIYAPDEPYDAALEVNQGALDAAGVSVGDRVTVSF